MAQSKWRCTNYINCEAANARKEFTTPKGAEFICTDCGQHGGVAVQGSPIAWVRYAIPAGGVALISLVVGLLWPPPHPPVRPTPDRDNGQLPAPAPGPLVDTETGLFKRILTRPQARLFTDANLNSAVLRTNIPDFSSFYVYKTASSSPTFYRVGSTDQLGPEGWIEGDDTIEWKQTLVLEFTPVEHRKPVLMFDDAGPLDDLLKPDGERSAKATAVYEQLKAGVVPPHLIGMEPSLYLGATKQFYLLPILDWKEVNMGGQEGRKLKITAAARGRGKVATTELVKEIRREPTNIKSFGKFKLDLVFVMDSTGSMQPYFDGAVSVLKDLSQWLQANADPASSIRFGLWCYQDAPTLTGIQYRTRNFTPTLQEGSSFVRTIVPIRANKPTHDPYSEDVFAGVMDGLNKTEWTPGAARIMILIGDAPGNPVNDTGNYYKIEAPQVGQAARDHGVRMVAIHLRDFTDPNFSKYHEIAEKQWKVMAEKSGAPGAYLRVDVHNESKKKDLFAPVLSELTTAFVTQIGDLLKGDTKVEAAPKESPKGIAQNLLKGAVVDWMSARAEEEGEPPPPPRDIVAWLVDRDLIDPAVQSLEPKILLNKNQLSELKMHLSRIIEQAKNAQIMNKDFIALLKAASLATTQSSPNSGSKSPEGEAPISLLPKYLEKLPYRSELMSVSANYSETLTQEELLRLIQSLESKMSYYTELHDNPGKWQPLNDKSAEGDYVTAVPLSQLP